MLKNNENKNHLVGTKRKIKYSQTHKTLLCCTVPWIYLNTVLNDIFDVSCWDHQTFSYPVREMNSEMTKARMFFKNIIIKLHLNSVK